MSRTLLLEIGCEELPASFVRGALEQLDRIAPDELRKARVVHGAVRALGTPRRIALHVEDVSEEIASRTEVVLGPAENVARGAGGQWSRAAEGFARKNDVALDALEVIDTPKGRYVSAQKVHAGGRAFDSLADVLGAIAARLSFAKSMRWADIETPFGRPVQWLVALYGTEIVPMNFVRKEAGRRTRGHRFLAPDGFELGDAGEYVARMRTAHVLADFDERRTAQFKALEAAARAAGGTLVRNPFLEDEVLGLVEEPYVVTGRFDPDFLALPDELIETVMSHHQRYFAVRGAERLLPVFLATVNTALDPDTIRKGNERVMRARLADARFFVEQDRTVRLEARRPRLDGVTYHAKLGSYGDKARRLEGLAPWVASQFAADEQHARRAAELCKTDLVSLAVGEFPELQGIMGREYARIDGEPEPVARAIEEHYRPKGADDSVAESRLGAAVSVADRLDTLVGFFAIGQKPSGAGDPFGLRRAVLGLLRTLLHHRARCSLRDAMNRAYALFERGLPRGVDELRSELGEFVRERLEGLLVQSYPVDVVRACLASGSDDPVDVLERVEAVAGMRATPDFARVVRAFERVFNISREAPSGEPDAGRLELPAERDLAEVFARVRSELRVKLEQREFTAALGLLAENLPGPVDRFFTEVFVMDEDLEIREARLRLLGRIADEVGVLARFDTLAGALA